MAADGTSHPTLTVPEREIAGGRVTHEYLPAQKMQLLFDKLDETSRKTIIQQATAVESGIDFWRQMQSTWLKTTGLAAPALASWAALVEQMLNSTAAIYRNSSDLFFQGIKSMQQAQQDGWDAIFDNATRLTLEQLYAQGNLKEVMAHYSESLGLTNELIEHNGAFYAFADEHSGGKMRQLDSSEGSADLDPRQWFPKGQPEEWPLLTLMSNTSAARDEDDIAIVAHGLEKLYFAAYEAPPHARSKL